MESVTKHPNHDQCITRDEGKKKQRGADTRQLLTGRAIDANGCQWVRSFFSHCDQAEAVREYKGSGSNAQQATHKQSELKNAPNKAIRYCPTLIRPG
jgi:hypothetical protein